RSITTVDAMKTISFEIAEQLTHLLGPPTLLESPKGKALPGVLWQSPDWYVQAVSGGLGPVGVIKGFDELKEMGLVDKVPSIANIQAEGCAPMATAWHANKAVADPVSIPQTHIATLATGDPGRTYTILRERMLNRNGGSFESVSDEDAFRAMHILAKMEGISVEPATGVAFAGLIKMVRAGQIKPTDVIVINCTGHTVPVEQSVLGEGWAQSVDYPVSVGEAEKVPQDGLLAALNNVTSERYPRIVIVDDHSDVRQLVRRILQAQGNFDLIEAEDGKSAVQIIQGEIPDLVILDLMMPEMDGFSVLDALKNNEKTAHIPVIVVTAKELTNQEKSRLKGQIQLLMQKGDFMSDELLAEVTSIIKKS
ncbi:MAG: pyridoxal-phosphate dependent enzyme, partial [Chloroflexota bacterium]